MRKLLISTSLWLGAPDAAAATADGTALSSASSSSGLSSVTVAPWCSSSAIIGANKYIFLKNKIGAHEPMSYSKSKWSSSSPKRIGSEWRVLCNVSMRSCSLWQRANLVQQQCNKQYVPSVFRRSACPPAQSPVGRPQHQSCRAKGAAGSASRSAMILPSPDRSSSAPWRKTAS